MKDVAAYIAGKGCRQPAYITADISISPSKERYEGFVEGLEENGISFNKRMHYAGTFSVETGQIGAMTLLQRNPEIDCIVCGNDLMAIGAVSVCEKLGKKIPEDIDYEDVGSLRIEARQKLEAYRPVSIGQASRISGVSPADISVLLVYLESRSGHKHG